MTRKSSLLKSEKKNTFTFQDVWDVVMLIPRGRVTTYGSIAKYLGSSRSSQMVGIAMNASHSKNIPAHRVVNKVGLLSGAHHFGTPTAMQELLEAEGIVIIENQIQDFEKVVWHPLQELA
jgi:methylated-DNA-protein-cysteine methyltransferase-like protein